MISPRLTAAVAAAVVVTAGGAGYAYQSSQPPKPQVLEGKIAAKTFDPAHEHRYFIMIQTGSICSGKPTVCTPIMAPFPMTSWVPDRWFLTAVGCPRLKKDAVKTYCAQTKQRTVQISESQFNSLRVGAAWRAPEEES